MRTQLRKKHFTKAERIFGELLKREHIPFKAKVKVLDREIDFLIGTLAIEINGHSQKEEKNKQLLEIGYIPINYTNEQIYNQLEKVRNHLWINITKQTSQP